MVKNRVLKQRRKNEQAIPIPVKQDDAKHPALTHTGPRTYLFPRFAAAHPNVSS